MNIRNFIKSIFGSDIVIDPISNKGRTERSHNWSLDDAVLTLYFYKFGVGKLGTVETLAHEYICSTSSSLKMQAANIRYLLDIKKIIGEAKFAEIKRYTKPENHTVRGLSHYGSNQRDAILKYDSLTEPELREIVNGIMNKKSKKERKQNLRMVRNRKVVDPKQTSLEI